MATDSINRQHQVATIQLDFNLPDRFGLSCINEKGEKERIVMIHSAIMGSIERFTAVLLEHLEGKLPLWLSPVHVKVLPVAESHAMYARTLYEKLTMGGLRVVVDDSAETLGKRIRAAKMEKVPYLLVVGDDEMHEDTATLESRDKGKMGTFPIDDITSRLQEELRART